LVSNKILFPVVSFSLSLGILVSGQIPPDLNSPEGCFSPGECTLSLELAQWAASSTQECLNLCREDGGCNYFTFHEERKLCLGFANCEQFSPSTCTECFSGGATCPGKLKWA